MAVWQSIYTYQCHADGMNGRDDEMAKTTFRLPKSLLKRAQRFGIDNDMTDTDIFNAALRQFLEAKSKKSQQE